MNAPPGAHRLGLGTAQLGLDYGVTNASGQVPDAEAAAMLQLAASSGIDTLDTAFLYGDSERVIGRTRPSATLRIVTKTPKFGGENNGEAAAAHLTAELDLSLERLGRDWVDVLLVHDADDLLGSSGANLWDAMAEARASGRAKRIGASVYDAAQIDALLERFPIEVVQLPWNPLDHRLDESRSFDRLAAAGVEIHARSLFLQGLLLSNPNAIAPKFGPLRAAISALHEWGASHDRNPLETVLALAFQRSAIDRFIVGATSTRELAAIVAAAKQAGETPLGDRFSIPIELDARYLNPSRWSELDEQG